MARKKPTLGMDPEFFVRSTVTGEVETICGKVGGDKGKGLPFAKVQGCADFPGEYLEDGVAIEINLPATGSAGGWNQYIRYTDIALKQLLISKNLEPVYTFSTYKFSNKQLDNPQAQTLGCDPDICAYGSVSSEGEWSPSARPKMTAADLGNLRHVGGHVHFGYNTEMIPRHVMVQLIDTFVYLPLLKYDKQTERRKVYGLAGLYREKDYGVEYRSMSNFWFMNTNKIQHNSMDYILAINAFALMNNVEGQQELMASLYSKLPLRDVKLMIDEGVSGKTQEARWVDLLQTIRKIPEMDTLNHSMLRGDF